MDTVTFFLEQGIDINIRNENGVSEQDYTADSKLVQPISAHVEKCGKVEQALLTSLVPRLLLLKEAMNMTGSLQKIFCVRLSYEAGPVKTITDICTLMSSSAPLLLLPLPSSSSPSHPPSLWPAECLVQLLMTECRSVILSTVVVLSTSVCLVCHPSPSVPIYLQLENH